MNQIDRDGGQKTQRLYRCSSNYALSKLIVNNGIEDLWRKENPNSSEFTHCDSSSGTRSRIDRVFTRIKILQFFFLRECYQFSVISVTRENIRISRLEKRTRKLLLLQKNSNQKLNQ